MERINKSSASRYYQELKIINEKNVNLNLDFYLKLFLVANIINDESININTIFQKPDQEELLLILKYAISEFPTEIQKLFQLQQLENLSEFDILQQFGFPISIIKFRINRINREIHNSMLT